MTERRFESRFLCADLVTVAWLARGSPGQKGPVADSAALRTVEAVLEDISALGACVQVEEPIPPGAAISISAEAGPVEAGAPQARAPVCFLGRVSYCVFRDYGYFVGIRFSEETRWSRGVFKPRHLTSLEALVAPATVQ